MKNLLFILLVFVSMAEAFAQDKDLLVVATSGSSYQMKDIFLDWTLGEVVIQFLDNPSTLLSQGFHQSAYSLTSINPIPVTVGIMLVLPNPFSDVLEVKMTYQEIKKGQVELFDINGKQLWKKPFEGMEIVEKHSTSSLPSGQYYFVVSLSEDSFLYSYPIIKI